MTAEERIRNIFSKLYLNEPVYQMVSLTHRLVMDKKIETIVVWKKEMHYNPDFIMELNDVDLKNVLFNELDRILLRHPYERKKKNPVAMYTASNLTLAEHGRNLGQVKVKDLYEYIQKKGYSEDQQKFMKLYESVKALPEDELKRKTGFTHEKLEKIISRIQLPELETMLKRHMEYYYNLLDRYIEPIVAKVMVAGGSNGEGGMMGSGSDGEDGEGGENGSGSHGKSGRRKNMSGKGNGSDENEDGEGSGSGKEKERKGVDRYNNPQNPGELSKDWDEDPIVENEIENAIREALITGQWGSITGGYKEALEASLKPKVNYKSILRHFRQSILSSNSSLNRMRPSRRFGFGFPGRKHEYTTKLAFFIDTSASVGSKALADCFGTINNIFSFGVQELDVYYFDTEIQNHKPLSIKRAQKNFVAFGRGGTNFQSVFDFLENAEKRYDGVVVFTDGECSVPNLKGYNPSDVCWLIDNEANYNSCKEGLSKVGRIAFVESGDEEV